MDQIRIRGARTHNLKNLNLDLRSIGIATFGALILLALGRFIRRPK